MPITPEELIERYEARVQALEPSRGLEMPSWLGALGRGAMTAARVVPGGIPRAEDLDVAGEAIERGFRTAGLPVGTVVGGVLNLFDPFDKTPVGRWLPGFGDLPDAFSAFREELGRGDWDAAISAYQDEMEAGPGFWGAAELAGSFLPTGGPAIAGTRLMAAAPKLAGTIARLAPVSPRTAVKMRGALGLGLGKAGQAMRIPWRLEEEMSRSALRGVGKGAMWLGGPEASTPIGRVVGRGVRGAMRPVIGPMARAISKLRPGRVAEEAVTPTAPPGPPGMAKEPWAMTRAEFRQPPSAGRQAVTNEYIRTRTGANTPQELLSYYQNKYPELKGVTIGGLRATKASGPLVNEGATRLVFDGGKFNPRSTKIHLTKDADLVVARHEVEHLLDAMHDFVSKVDVDAPRGWALGKFGRYDHAEFNASDYLHRSLVRDAISKGRLVPDEVLRDYPELAAKQITPTTTTPPVTPGARSIYGDEGLAIPERYTKEWPFGAPPGRDLAMGVTGVPLRGAREQAAHLLTTREGLTAEIKHVKKLINDELKAKRRSAGMAVKRKRLADYDAAIRGQVRNLEMLQDRLAAMPVPGRKPIPRERALARLDPVRQAQVDLTKKIRASEPMIIDEEFRRILPDVLERTKITLDEYWDIRMRYPKSDYLEVNSMASEAADSRLANMRRIGEKEIVAEEAARMAGGKPVTLADTLRAASRVDAPSPRNPPNKGGPPSGQGGVVDDVTENGGDVFARILRSRIEGEVPEETLMRVHSGAIADVQNELRVLMDEGDAILRAAGIGVIRQGRLVIRKQDVPRVDALFEALHSPSKVATGEVRVPEGLEEAYEHLRRLTDWEEGARLTANPDMATVRDYFFRGWLSPKGMGPAVSGAFGRKPSFLRPRVDATYREMRNAGFEPISWNPYDQFRIGKLQRVRHEQQMMLLGDLKAHELAKSVTDVRKEAVDLVKGWRVPKVGPAFEGTTQIGRNPLTGALGEFREGQYITPGKIANMLENMYGRPAKDETLYVGALEFNMAKALDTMVFIPKRAKLFGSFFQQIDFQSRFYFGTWASFADALSRGRPLDAVMHLARWPKFAFDILEANFSTGARVRLRKQFMSTEPLVPGRPGIHLLGIVKAGLSTIDETLLPRDLDKMARELVEELGLLGNKAVGRAVLSMESWMRRGLFEGTYPATHIAAIKNYIAPMIVRGHGHLSDEAINGMIAKVANTSYSTIPAVQSILAHQRPWIRETLRRVFFSIGETEGLMRQVTGMIPGRGGTLQRYWVTHWIGVYLGLAALANAIHFGATGEVLPFQRWTPISKNRWGPSPVGYNQEFMAPDIPVRDVEGRRLTIDLVGQMDTALRLLDPMAFVEARESVPIRAIITQVGGRDFYDRPIDRVGPGGVVSRMAHAINDLFTPIGPGQAAVQVGLQTGVLPKDIIGETETRLGIPGHLLQAPGLNIRALEGWRTQAARAVDDLTFELHGVETNYYDLPKHPFVTIRVKEQVPVRIRGLVDEWMEADFRERRELEREGDFRFIRDRYNETAQDGGVLYRLRKEFADTAGSEWKMTMARLGRSFPGATRPGGGKVSDWILEELEKGRKFPVFDYSKWGR